MEADEDDEEEEEEMPLGPVTILFQGVEVTGASPPDEEDTDVVAEPTVASLAALEDDDIEVVAAVTDAPDDDADAADPSAAAWRGDGSVGEAPSTPQPGILDSLLRLGKLTGGGAVEGFP